MALNHPRGRLALRKYRFHYRTTGVKIWPPQPHPLDRMSDEFRQASDLIKDPSSVTWSTYFWVVFVAAWGGVVRVIRKSKLGGKTWQQVTLILAMEMVTSSFAGVITFFLCQSNNIQPFYTAVMTSLAGYMGGSALDVLEAVYRARIDKGTGDDA